MHVEWTKMFLHPQHPDKFSAKLSVFLSSVPRQIEQTAPDFRLVLS